MSKAMPMALKHLLETWERLFPCSRRSQADDNNESCKGEDSKCDIMFTDTAFQIAVTQVLSCHQNVVSGTVTTFLCDSYGELHWLFWKSYLNHS